MNVHAANLYRISGGTLVGELETPREYAQYSRDNKIAARPEHQVLIAYQGDVLWGYAAADLLESTCRDDREPRW